MNLRPYQVSADSRIDRQFAGGARRVLAVLPTGGGKTVIFASRALRSPGRVLILAHRKELIRQAVSKIPGSSIYPGRDAGRIVVGSVQTLARRLDRLPRFDDIIVDEAHHTVAGQFRQLLDSQPQARVLGVTATPERLDGKGLGDFYEAMVLGPSVQELQALGYLSPVEVYAPAAPPDVQALHTLAGDFNPRELNTLMDTPSVTGDAVDHYQWYCPGKPTIGFCVSVEHARATAAAFRAAGWRAVAVAGDDPAEHRDGALAGLAAGTVELVFSCSLIDEGLDIPAVSCVIDLAPTKSLGRWLQRVGRGMRPAPGKRHMWLLDHAGNTLRHGMPDEPRPWSLTGRERRSITVPATRQCPDCFAIHRPAACCPGCGFDYEAARVAAERREIERREGELARLTPEDRRLQMLRSAPLAELTAGATFEQLQEIAAARGYSPGWVRVQTKFRRGGLPAPRTSGEEFA
ncbi:DEAD/DEAH box helicase [Roseomonas sp. USHLN139]|uniref:DEAD/DEAH box helicase n=1 Tax=Roseomonas sp. USHLN139 TaxID=3081298 RepID=UPI003B0232ED